MEDYNTRRCCRCHIEKPLSEFYRSKGQPLGRAYLCRVCSYTPREKKPRLQRPIPTELVCPKCGKTKPLTEFKPDKRRYHGRSSYCRACHRSYKALHPRQLKAKLSPGDNKTCNRCNKTKPAEQFDHAKDGDGYRNQCKECVRPDAREWKRRNRDRIREYERKNYDRLSALRRNWQERNRDKVIASRRRRYKTAESRLYHRNKAALRRTLSRQGDVTDEKLQRLLDSQQRCYYCRKPFNKSRKKTIDHVIPITKGGQHMMSNLVVACQSCNSKKKDRLILLL